MIRFATLGLIVFFSACSGSEETARTREVFCQQWAKEACSSAVVSACQASSAETCRLTQQGFCMSLVPTNFSDAAADACLSAVRDAYADADLTGTELDTVLQLGGPCARVVEGPASVGETCTTSRDCQGSAGYECVTKGGQAQGTCQLPELIGPGLKCAAAQQVCMEGFYCNGSNCIEAKGAGESCTNDEECGISGWCGSEGVCSARLLVDAPCTASNQCASGLCYTFSADDRTCSDRLRLSRSEPVCENLR